MIGYLPGITYTTRVQTKGTRTELDPPPAPSLQGPQKLAILNSVENKSCKEVIGTWKAERSAISASSGRLTQ